MISDTSANIRAQASRETVARSKKSVTSAVRMLKSCDKSSIVSKLSKVSRAEVKLVEAKAASADAPLQGALLFLMYTILSSSGYLTSTFLYNRNADLNPFQLLTLRAAFSMSFQIMLYNRELKAAVWDGVDRASAGPLFFRSMQGVFSNVINFSATACVPLTMISIINNMSPLVTLVLAFIILKERIKFFEIVMIVLLVSGIIVVVVSADGEAADSSSNISQTLVWVIYGALVMNPFMIAGGAIAMRKMKKFHDAVVSWYLNLSLGLLSVTACLVGGFFFAPVANFDWVSWLLIILCGFFALSSQTCRFMGLKRQKASKL